MLIGQVIPMTEKVLVGGVFTWEKSLVSLHSKKQNSISLSTVEAEYIVVGSFCRQLLWMKQVLADYRIVLESFFVFCNNTSAINISKNLVQHSRTKHIDIHHHFIRDLIESNVLILEFVETKKQLADIFTKVLDFVRFEFLRKSLGICSF